MSSDLNFISRRALVTHIGAGVTGAAMAAAVPAEGQSSSSHDNAAPFVDPTSKYPKPPYPGQSQPWPGLAGKMPPQPDHGETSYKVQGGLPDVKL